MSGPGPGTRAPHVGYAALTGAALLAALLPSPWQLGYAVLAIGVIGMAHGASDLAIVAPPRRAAFLLLYAAVSLTCLWWWTAHPSVALPLFLLASAIHFGLEDAPDGPAGERIARGFGLVAIPAVLHRTELADLLSLAGGQAALVPDLVRAMAIPGGATAAALLILAAHRRDLRLGTGTLALLLLPPLVGFSLGFLILHALPQTTLRRAQLGCATNRAYARQVLPVLLLAFGLAGMVGAILLRADGSGVRALFAGIAALAVPHLLVTPWFERPSRVSAEPALA